MRSAVASRCQLAGTPSKPLPSFRLMLQISATRLPFLFSLASAGHLPFEPLISAFRSFPLTTFFRLRLNPIPNINALLDCSVASSTPSSPCLSGQERTNSSSNRHSSSPCSNHSSPFLRASSVAPMPSGAWSVPVVWDLRDLTPSSTRARSRCMRILFTVLQVSDSPATMRFWL